MGCTDSLCQNEGVDGHPLNFSLVVCSPLTDILRNKTFTTKHGRKLPIPWTEKQEGTFSSLKKSVALLSVLAFPDWNQPFTLHMDASSIGTRAVITQGNNNKEVVIAYARHWFSRKDSR